MKITFEVYEDKHGEFRWHAKRAGRIVADGGEGYVGRGHANRAVRNFIKAITTGKFSIKET